MLQVHIFFLLLFCGNGAVYIDYSFVALSWCSCFFPLEYAGGGRASTCGDVYSFGIVVLEVLTGKRPTDPMFENELNIVSFVETNFTDQIFQVIDAALQEECNHFSSAAREVYHQCLSSLVEVALSCTRQYPTNRMNMRQAADKLREIQASYVIGKPKEVPAK